MKFFKGRLVHNIYIITSVVFFIVGLLVSNYSDNREIVFGVGKVLQYSFAILFILLIILYLLPRRVFCVWRYVSAPFIVYVFFYSISVPALGDCTMIGCNDRDFGVYMYSIVFSFFSLIISLIISIIWHFVEKKKKIS